VTHICNPRYSRDRDQEDGGSIRRGKGGEMTQILYAHTNIIKKGKKKASSANCS
jgi:hypothetical protein